MKRKFFQKMIERSVDLGHDHYLLYHGWFPDRKLNPQYIGYQDVEKLGALIIHRARNSELWGMRGWCAGSIQFKTPETEPILHIFPGATWIVRSWDPLHIEPSVLCSCGDHGFIRNSLWIPV